MSESDSLDHITLDSDDILTIERFENNYYNHKKNIIQNGGNNNKKLENNIIRLYNCYVLSENQDKLSLQIKKRLNKKIVELANNLIGGRAQFSRSSFSFPVTEETIKENIKNTIKNNKDEIINNIITSLKIAIDDIGDNYIQYLNIILKAPNNILTYIDYKNWLYEQIKNWIKNEKNKNDIFNQIILHIDNFIKSVPTQEVAPTQKVAPTQEIPVNFVPRDIFDGIGYFLKQQAPIPIKT